MEVITQVQSVKDWQSREIDILRQENESLRQAIQVLTLKLANAELMTGTVNIILNGHEDKDAIKIQKAIGEISKHRWDY